MVYRGKGMERESLRIALAQINTTVGDIAGNLALIKEAFRNARSLGADIVAFPELSVTGYPPEDLLMRPLFIDDNLAALKKIAAFIDERAAVVGFVDRLKGTLFNAAAVLYKGKVRAVYHKMLLPNYGVFDEKRYFAAGVSPLVLRLGGCVFGVSICEDIWHEEGPTAAQAKRGAALILNINASPYHAGKIAERQRIVAARAKRHGVAIAYVNLVGGQDELVFDGQSMVLDGKGKIVARAPAFREELLTVDIPLVHRRVSARVDTTFTSTSIKRKKPSIDRRMAQPLERAEEVYKALLLGLSDYVRKNGFRKVVIGLSGGIDSSLVAALAADCLGKENVSGIFMPSRYSSDESRDDARRLAHNLGISFSAISIEQIYRMYLLVLEPHFAGLPKNIAEENLQARIRGNLLMALSNKFGWLVLTTGNKSEMSTGYATLYGDMAGGFAVIKDVPKTLVYELCRYRNAVSDVIPENVLRKEPTAELKPNQKDSDSLPPYPVLDPILEEYVERDEGIRAVIDKGFDAKTVERVFELVDRSEYKRRQSPPGIKITPRAFGRDRRMPITNKYRGSHGV